MTEPDFAVNPVRDHTPDLATIARPAATPAALGDAVEAFFPDGYPAVLGLGEPAHGLAAFPTLRNQLLVELVDRGFRSIALEIDLIAARVVDDFVAGRGASVVDALAAFSHQFGNIPGQHELLKWLREFNQGRSESDRVRFYGFDGPVEMAAAPSPARAMVTVRNALRPDRRPLRADEIESLAGPDEAWTAPEAMYNPSASIGLSESAQALRPIAVALQAAVAERASDREGSGEVDPDAAWWLAAQARDGVGLLDYHASMATEGPNRFGELLARRADMMAANLLAIHERERDRGPVLVFAHNAHLQLAPGSLAMGAEDAAWANAGSRVHEALGGAYGFVASDAALDAAAGTFQAALASATTGRTGFGAAEVLAALTSDLPVAGPMFQGHIPVTPASLRGAAGVVFLTDTDGVPVQFWQ